MTEVSPVSSRLRLCGALWWTSGDFKTHCQIQREREVGRIKQLPAPSWFPLGISSSF